MKLKKKKKDFEYADCCAIEEPGNSQAGLCLPLYFFFIFFKLIN